MILKVELEDIKEEDLVTQLGEDVNGMILRLVETRVRDIVKSQVEKQFKQRIVIELEQMALPAIREALKDPSVQERIDTYAQAIVHDVVKKKVLAHTEAWLREAAKHE